MIVLNPNTTTHLFKVIPRSYTYDELTFNLTNEETGETTEEAIYYLLEDGYLYCSLEKNLSNNSNYTLKITNNDFVIFRGKIFVTNQETQNFRITKDYLTI